MPEQAGSESLLLPSRERGFKKPLFFLNSGCFMRKFLKISNMAAEKKKRRKRRDSTSVLKPPLDFIESPLNGQRHYCTPVQAARRPFLAASLPVDDEVSMKWVGIRSGGSVHRVWLKALFSKRNTLTHCCLWFFRPSPS